MIVLGTYVFQQCASLLKVDHVQHALESVSEMGNLDQANHQSVRRVNELQFFGCLGALLF
jgi:hypothetical protein